jgi:DNA polymerase elongation subunit (family B)
MDLEKYCEIEFDILQGYYFDSDRNDTVNKVINNLYNMRKEYKKSGNPFQLVLKLIMNAAYGITGMRAKEQDVKYIQDSKKDAFIDTHFNEIKCITQMNNNEWRFEMYKEIESHYNRQHVACEILSVSKNIMNEVICLAEEIGAPIWYTDTDSMHIDEEWVAGEGESKLGKAFRQKYNRELIGSNLGQFHTDFDMGGSYMTKNGALVKCTHKSEGNLVATESIFLGKKCYIDKLQDEAHNVAYHIRLKGIKINSIIHKCTTEYKGDPMAMFLELFRGKELTFNLSDGGVCFKVNKNHTMSTVSLKRTVGF